MNAHHRGPGTTMKCSAPMGECSRSTNFAALCPKVYSKWTRLSPAALILSVEEIEISPPDTETDGHGSHPDNFGAKSKSSQVRSRECPVSRRAAMYWHPRRYQYRSRGASTEEEGIHGVFPPAKHHRIWFLVTSTTSRASVRPTGC